MKSLKIIFSVLVIVLLGVSVKNAVANNKSGASSAESMGVAAVSAWTYESYNISVSSANYTEKFNKSPNKQIIVSYTNQTSAQVVLTSLGKSVTIDPQTSASITGVYTDAGGQVDVSLKSRTTSSLKGIITIGILN